MQNAIGKAFDSPFSHIHVSNIVTNMLMVVSDRFSMFYTFLISIVSQSSNFNDYNKECEYIWKTCVAGYALPIQIL